jgi:hypothetical protein
VEKAHWSYAISQVFPGEYHLECLKTTVDAFSRCLPILHHITTFSTSMIAVAKLEPSAGIGHSFGDAHRKIGGPK